MAPTVVRHEDLIVDQGSDYPRTIPVTGLADGETLAGWTVYGQIRAGYADTSPLLHTLDVTLSGTDVVLRIPGATSAAWTWRLGRYDVVLVDPDGGPGRFLEGSVVVRPQISRLP